MVVAKEKGCGMINSAALIGVFDLGRKAPLAIFEIVSQIGRNLFIQNNIVISKRTSSGEG